MGLMDRIKKVTGTNDNYDDSYDDDYYGGFDEYDDVMDDSDVQMSSAQPQGMNSQMSMGAQMGGISLSGSNIKMQVVRPKNYDSDTTSQIANHLLNKCTVVLNLENTNKETSRRLIDFLTGVAYSIGGDLKKIATNAYVITPSNVDVENAQIKTTAARPEPQREVNEVPVDDFGDFN
ncbi:MAG: cell division protein SepF [Ruminococcaceae bacterium]|nr:cell division protein SepF [Oscillospiraceae bacterium]